MRHRIGAHDAETIHLLQIHRLVGFGHLLCGAAFIGCAVDDLVVNVGDVHHEPHLVAPPDEIAADDIVGESGASVADVGRVVDGRPASVDADLAVFAS